MVLNPGDESGGNTRKDPNTVYMYIIFTQNPVASMRTKTHGISASSAQCNSSQADQTPCHVLKNCLCLRRRAIVLPGLWVQNTTPNSGEHHLLNIKTTVTKYFNARDYLMTNMRCMLHSNLEPFKYPVQNREMVRT